MGLVVHQIEFKVRKLRVQPSTPPSAVATLFIHLAKSNCQVTFLSHLIKSKAPAFEASAGTLAEFQKLNESFTMTHIL